MKKGKIIKVAATTMGAVFLCGTLTAFAGCGGGKPEALVIMTEELNGLFNPFYSTAGTDMDVVGQTQVSMFSTDSKGEIAYGDDEPVVVKDYYLDKVSGDGENAVYDYYFVIKNGLKFSDGKPLTMNDVLFNLYVYLDPAYTGSSTMYSTKIQGLADYRSQTFGSSGSGSEDNITQEANNRAFARRRTLSQLFQYCGRSSPTSTSYYVTVENMRNYIAGTATPANGYDVATYLKNDRGYKTAIWPNGIPTADDGTAITDQDQVVALVREQLLEDYNDIVGDPNATEEDDKKGLFRLELERDYEAAVSSYTEPPYTNKNGDNRNKTDLDFSDEITAFLVTEGYIELDYVNPATGHEDKDLTIYSVKTGGDLLNTIKNKEAAINYVYEDKVHTELNMILAGWATGETVLNNYVGMARDVVMHEQAGSDGDSLRVPNISGVRSLSLDHMPAGENPATGSGSAYHDGVVTIDGTNYTVATAHNPDGTVVNPDEYDVLRIRVDGSDPKAVWNFGFTVAPHHYYSDPAKYPVNIKNNQFGVSWADFKFQTQVLQGTSSAEFGSVSKNKVPLGAGPYAATNRSEDDYPSSSSFISNNVVYYKANENFSLDGKTSATPKIRLMRYQVVSANNALNQLERGGVHFIEPQGTKDNYDKLDELKKSHYDYVESWTLGYGYIGINAGKIPDINIRKAIMSAMNVSLSLQYYKPDTAVNIQYPMSLVSWAYPRTTPIDQYDPENPLLGRVTNNGKTWTQFSNDANAKTAIRGFMRAANVTDGDSRLKIQFTIAGSSLTDHPCFEVFNHARELLNDCGWSVEVIPDTNALIKLSTGSLAVWAAAWGSTIDPDMYQVYHKNSTATSVFAWGYREILSKAAPSGWTYNYSEENTILNDLSELIDDARATMVTSERAPIYREALEKALDLAVELPVYQRTTIYAFNTDVLKESSLPHDEQGNTIINSYSSPLSRIWELEFAD